MKGELQWGPLWGKCGLCGNPTRFRVDTDHHPHINGKVGVVCGLCNKASIYTFEATVEAEMASQASGKKLAEGHLSRLPQFHPEEWPLFQAAMFELMPQPTEPEEFTPPPRTLFVWQLMKAEGRGPLDQVEAQEDHGLSLQQ